jgi:hypothetical protein
LDVVPTVSGIFVYLILSFVFSWTLPCLKCNDESFLKRLKNLKKRFCLVKLFIRFLGESHWAFDTYY